MLLGCIADDFTGATDLANNLVRAGMRTLQSIGVPALPLTDEVDAVVVALKTRTLPAAEAVAQSLQALAWLQRCGAERFYFKYCSTFDSTPQGNIGPVTAALMDALQCDFTIACPAFPVNGRTVFKGHLFVGDVLLSESGMRDHPLTPMREANLVRVLQAQTTRRVGLIAYDVVSRGEAAIRARITELKATGVSIAVVDAITNEDLYKLGPALRDLPLVTAGSGVAIGLPQNFANRLAHAAGAAQLPARAGFRAVIAGSCSEATNAQVAHFMQTGGAAYAIDVMQLASGHGVVESVLEWARPRLQKGPVLIYSTATARQVQLNQQRLGAAAAGALIEQGLARIAGLLVAAGVTQLVVAGGETSGAVVQALGAKMLRIGPQIDPGVPWTAVEGGPPLLLALKSGNFGSVDFFTKCFAQLDEYERTPTA